MASSAHFSLIETDNSLERDDYGENFKSWNLFRQIWGKGLFCLKTNNENPTVIRSTHLGTEKLSKQKAKPSRCRASLRSEETTVKVSLKRRFEEDHRLIQSTRQVP